MNLEEIKEKYLNKWVMLHASYTEDISDIEQGVKVIAIEKEHGWVLCKGFESRGGKYHTGIGVELYAGKTSDKKDSYWLPVSRITRIMKEKPIKKRKDTLFSMNDL
jgi:hypothetical protein